MVKLSEAVKKNFNKQKDDSGRLSLAVKKGLKRQFDTQQLREDVEEEKSLSQAIRESARQIVRPTEQKEFSFQATPQEAPQITTTPKTKTTTPEQIGEYTDISDVAGMLARGIARGGVATIKGFMKLPAEIEAAVSPTRENVQAAEEARTFKPEGKVEKFVLGEESISLATEGRDISFGLVSKESQIAPFIGAGMGIADILSLGTSRGIKSAIKAISKAKLTDEVIDALRGIGISERSIQREAPDLVSETKIGRIKKRIEDLVDEEKAIAARQAGEQIARTETPDQIQEALERAGFKSRKAKKKAKDLAEETDPQKIAREIAPESVSRAESKGILPSKTTDEIVEDVTRQTSKSGVRESLSETRIIDEMLDSQIEQLAKTTDETQVRKTLDEITAEQARGVGRTEVPEEFQSLVEEARKYESPEDFEGAVFRGEIDEEVMRQSGFKVTAPTRLVPGAIDEVPKKFPKDAQGGADFGEFFNRVKGGVERIPGAPTAKQRAGERVVTPRGRKLVESATDRENVSDAGYDSAREIEDLMKVPVKTSEDVSTMKRVAEAEGFDVQPRRIAGVEVGDLAGHSFFPNSSRIKQAQREIQKIRAQRLRGEIDPKKANEQVEKLNKEINDLAEKVGVAQRVMSDGSKKPALRKSGIYAEKEWENYTPKDDIKVGKVVEGQSFNLRDGMFALDGVTAEEAAARGYWGQGAYLQYGIRQADAAKSGFDDYHGQRIQDILYNKGLKTNTKTGRQLNLALWGINRQSLKAGNIESAVDEVIAKLEVTPEAAQKARPELIKVAKDMPDEVFDASDEVRGVLDELREQANVVRKEMGKPPIGFIEDYGPLLSRQSFWKEMMADTKTTITDNFDFIIPNAKKNPHAIPREGGMDAFETNALESLSRYIDNISNDIFMAPQIEKLKSIRSVLRGNGLSGSPTLIDRFIRENITGQPGPLSFKIGTKKEKFAKRFIQARSIYALAGNLVWSAIVQPASLTTLTIPRAGGLTHGVQNTLGGIYDFVTNSRIRKKMKTRPTTVIKTRGASVGMTGAGDMDKLAGKIQRGKVQTYNDYLGKFSDAQEYWLTNASIGAGYRHGKKLGLKGRELDIYADWMGGATQSEYNKVARPLMLNNTLVRVGFPFQTFANELYRYSKTLVGAKGGMPLKKSQRINQAIMLLVGTHLYNQFTEATIGRSLTSPGSAIPLVGGFVDQQIDKYKEALGFQTEERYGYGRSPVAPAEDIKEFRSAIDAFVQYDNPKPMIQFGTKWGMGMSKLAGAQQVNNFWEGMVANITGMKTKKSGEFAFPVNGNDMFLSPILGPYSTQAGKKYLNQRQKAEREKAKIRPIFDKAQKLVEEGKQKQAKAIINSLNSEQWETYKKLRAVERRRQTEEDKVVMYPVYKKAQRLVKEDKEKEAQEIVDNLSEEEWDAYKKIRDQARKFETAKGGEKPEFFDGELVDNTHIVELVVVYAEAIGKDLETAFKTMFTGEKLRKIEGDAAIIQRMPLQESQRMRQEMAEERENLDELELDHIVPLQLGGDNSKENLQLIPEGIHDTYTRIDNHLGRLLRKGEISEEEAQELTKDFKQGRIPASEILER